MSPSSWSVVAGAALLLAALTWWAVHRLRLRAALRTALADPDPVRRRAGVLVATEHGLRANAALLAAHVAREDHPDVLAAVVAGVLRHSWEPSDHRSIMGLRLWAHAQPAVSVSVPRRAPEITTEALPHVVARPLPRIPALSALDADTVAQPAIATRAFRLVPFTGPPTDGPRPTPRHRATRQRPESNGGAA